MLSFINTCISLLGLKYPLRLSYSAEDTGNACAWYQTRRTKNNKFVHRIVVYSNIISMDTRSKKAIIAHELIHAWQEEYKTWEEHEPYHNEAFGSKAEWLRIKLKEHGFYIRNIYMPDVDVS